MTDFLKTILLVNGLVAAGLFVLFMLTASPAHSMSDGISSAVGAAAGFVADAMDTSGGDDDE